MITVQTYFPWKQSTCKSAIPVLHSEMNQILSRETANGFSIKIDNFFLSNNYIYHPGKAMQKDTIRKAIIAFIEFRVYLEK